MIDYQDHALLLNESYRHWTGEYIVEQNDPGKVLAALNEADFVVVSHGMEAEPVFNYGNLAAFTLFGYEHLDFLRLMTSKTVGTEGMAGRQALTEQIDRDGFTHDYHGVRMTSSGQRFKVDASTVWKLQDNLGRVHGHAAIFREWHFLETL
mgnify:FL=1